MGNGNVWTVGVVGVGGIGRPHLQAWRELGAATMVHSTGGRAAAVAAQYGATACGSLEELIQRSDIVDVCTPTRTHEEIVLAAAAAGRDVVCEKPLSLTHAAAAAMIAACESAGVALYPGQVVRFFPAYAAARAAVAAGNVGTPAVIRLLRRGAAPTQPWFSDPAQSGGLIVDQMIHDFDFARWIAGDVGSVNAKLLGENGGPSIGLAILTHRSGAISHLTGGWGRREEVFRTAFSIAGSAGLITHNTTLHPALTFEGQAEVVQSGALLPDISIGPTPYLAELAEFAAAFAGGPTPRVTAADSLAALDIALAAAESARTGRPVVMPEVFS